MAITTKLKMKLRLMGKSPGLQIFCQKIKLLDTFNFDLMSALVKSVNQKVAEIHLERNRNVNLRQHQQKFKIKVVD